MSSGVELTTKRGEADDAGDRSLVARIRTGDDAAAAELYARYARRVLGLAKQQMSAQVRFLAEPEDIVQSAFRSLFRGISSGSYDAPEGESLWKLVAVIAVHKVRRKASRNKSVATASLDSSREGRPDGEPVSAASPAALEAGLREAIECLRPVERDVVLLRVQGFLVEEISEQLQRSRRTIERALHSAREKLADQFLQEDGA